MLVKFFQVLILLGLIFLIEVIACIVYEVYMTRKAL
jgi:hypothetical protein